MASSARGNSNYGVKPSSYFYASVEVYLSTFQTVEWYGYGKASADTPMYYAGQYSGDLATGLEIYANMIGTRTLVTSPLFWKFERSVGISNDIAISRQDVKTFYLEHGGTTLNWAGANMAACGLHAINTLLQRDTSAVDTNVGAGSVTAAPIQSNNQAPLAPNPAVVTAITPMAAATAAATAAAIGAASQVLITSAIRGAEETDNSRTRRLAEKEAAAAEEEEAEEENGDE